MEDNFQRLKRLVRKGAENRVISLDRMYHKLIRTSVDTFPNVGQATVDVEELESTSGSNRSLAASGAIVATYGGSLAKAAFTPDTKQHWIKKPVSGYKTCNAVAFSQQVGVEECLLQSELVAQRAVAANVAVKTNFFKDLRFLRKSWACGLVPTVRDVAKQLLEPYVLGSISAGCLWLIPCSLGRCLLGWPLQLISAEDHFFQPRVPLTRASLKRIIVTDPLTTDEYANIPVKRKVWNDKASARPELVSPATLVFSMLIWPLGTWHVIVIWIHHLHSHDLDSSYGFP